MQTQLKLCNTCGAWERGQAPQGECRKNAPVIAGWPKVNEGDWCCQWIKDERPKNTTKEIEMWRISINYVFVRDFPDLATKWLESVIEKPELIPAPVREVILRPFDNLASHKIPDWINGGTCCEGILHWAEQIEGFCYEKDDSYIGLLITSKYEGEVAASVKAYKEVPQEHPWRAIAERIANIEI